MYDFSQYHETRPATALWTFDSVTAWSLLNRCTAELDTTVKRFGNATWKITPDGSGTTQTRALNLATPIDVSGKIICFRVYIPDEVPSGSLQFIMSNTGASVTNAAVFSFNANSVKPGWNSLLMHFSDRGASGQPSGYAGLTYGTGAVHTSSINAIEVDYTSPGTNPFYLDSILIGRRVRPAVVFGFDLVMQQELVDWALPALNDLGTNAYLAISFQGKSYNFTNNALNQVARDAGWKFVFHSEYHTNYTSMTQEERIADWKIGMEHMRTGGWFDYQDEAYEQFFVPPENGWNKAVADDLRKLGVQYGRAYKGARNYFDTDGLMVPEFQGSLELNNNNSLAAAKVFVDDCIHHGYLLHFFGHGLTAGAATSLTWNKDDFIALCAYIKTKKKQGFIDTPDWLEWHKYQNNPTFLAY